MWIIITVSNLSGFLELIINSSSIIQAENAASKVIFANFC